MPSGRVPTDRRIRMLSKISINHITKCWNFCGSITKKGYGRFCDRNVGRLAHTVAWEIFVGPIPSGKQIHHVCENKICVNPEHLIIVTPKEHTHLTLNSLGFVNSKKTHCPYGHQLSGNNLVGWKLRHGMRNCRTCLNRHILHWHERNKTKNTLQLSPKASVVISDLSSLNESGSR